MWPSLLHHRTACVDRKRCWHKQRLVSVEHGANSIQAQRDSEAEQVRLQVDRMMYCLQSFTDTVVLRRACGGHALVPSGRSSIDNPNRSETLVDKPIPPSPTAAKTQRGRQDPRCLGWLCAAQVSAATLLCWERGRAVSEKAAGVAGRWCFSLQVCWMCSQLALQSGVSAEQAMFEQARVGCQPGKNFMRCKHRPLHHSAPVSVAALDGNEQPVGLDGHTAFDSSV